MILAIHNSPSNDVSNWAGSACDDFNVKVATRVNGNANVAGFEDKVHKKRSLLHL